MQNTSDVIVNWSKQLANGMSYIHSKKVIHRDLKSGNSEYMLSNRHNAEKRLHKAGSEYKGARDEEGGGGFKLKVCWLFRFLWGRPSMIQCQCIDVVPVAKHNKYIALTMFVAHGLQECTFELVV